MLQLPLDEVLDEQACHDFLLCVPHPGLQFDHWYALDVAILHLLHWSSSQITRVRPLGVANTR